MHADYYYLHRVKEILPWWNLFATWSWCPAWNNKRKWIFIRYATIIQVCLHVSDKFFLLGKFCIIHSRHQFEFIQNNNNKNNFYSTVITLTRFVWKTNGLQMQNLVSYMMSLQQGIQQKIQLSRAGFEFTSFTLKTGV
jgi:hypothetical protein